MAKRLIIGCGYVGREVASLWQQAGHEVTVTTTTPSRLSELAAIASHAELFLSSDRETLGQLLQGQETVLLAVGAKSRDLDSYRQSYLTMAQNLAHSLDSASSLRQIIYLSSYSVLGDQQGAWADETTPVMPTSDYGKILAETEGVLLALAQPPLKVSILRLAGIYGKGRELIKIFRTWSGTTRPGDGSDYSNWVHREDIVRGVDFVCDRNLSGLYHLTGDVPQQTQAFFDQLFAHYQLPSITWDASRPSVRPYNTRLSNQKIKAEGFELLHPQALDDLSDFKI